MTTFRLSLFVTHYALRPFATLDVHAATLDQARSKARVAAAKERCDFWMLTQ